MSALTPVAIGATITWEGGGGDNSWHNRLNWSGDALPGATDDVVITIGNANVVVSTSVSANMLTLGAGVQLTVQGAGVKMNASGDTTIDGANLSVLQGALLELPSLRRVTATTGSNPTLSANGNGSILDLPAVESLAGNLYIKAQEGGSVQMDSLTENVSGGSADFLARGTGSVLELKNVETLTDGAIVVTGATTVLLPKLSSVAGMGLQANQGALLQLPSLRRVTISAAISGHTLRADGVDSVLNLPAVNFLSGPIYLIALNGGRILCEAVESITTGAFNVTSRGEGSLVDFSSLKLFEVPNTGSRVEAAEKGIVALPQDLVTYGVTLVGVTPGIVFPAIPQIIQPPVDQVVLLDSTAAFAVVAEGTEPISYRWQNEAMPGDWRDLAGATSATLVIPNVRYSKVGYYRCILVNVGGKVLSQPARLSVGGPQAPMVTRQPEAQATQVGGAATFRVVALGTPPPSYQWRKNGANLTDDARIVGTASTTLRLRTVERIDAGEYTVVVSNSVGSTTSQPATLVIVKPLTITTSPLPEGFVGAPYSHALTATGGVTPYTWTVVSGSLPAGLSLSGAGVIDGPRTVALARPTPRPMNVPPLCLPAAQEQLHQTYCRLTGQNLTLRFDRERLWFEFHRAGFTLADLVQVVRCLQTEIRHTRRNVGALKLSHLLPLDRFEEDLNISRVRLRPEPPPPQTSTPRLEPCSPEERERRRHYALAQLRQLKDKLRLGQV